MTAGFCHRKMLACMQRLHTEAIRAALPDRPSLSAASRACTHSHATLTSCRWDSRMAMRQWCSTCRLLTRHSWTRKHLSSECTLHSTPLSSSCFACSCSSIGSASLVCTVNQCMDSSETVKCCCDKDCHEDRVTTDQSLSWSKASQHTDLDFFCAMQQASVPTHRHNHGSDFAGCLRHPLHAQSRHTARCAKFSSQSNVESRKRKREVCCGMLQEFQDQVKCSAMKVLPSLQTRTCGTLKAIITACRTLKSRAGSAALVS